MAGIDQFGMLVLDIEVNRTRRATFKNDHVPAGHLELAAELAPGIRAGDRACQRALGHRRPAAAGRGHRAGQWPGRDDELVVRRERIELGGGLLPELFCSQTALTKEGFGPRHVQGFGHATARSQVDSQQLALPAHDSNLRLRRARGGCAEAGATEHSLSLTQWCVANNLILTTYVCAGDHLTQAADFDCPRVKRLKSLHRAGVTTNGVGQRKSAAWVKSVSAPTGQGPEPDSV